MNMQENLRALAARDVDAAPFEFEVFERRRALAVVRRRATKVSAAGSVAALAFVAIMALITQGPPRMSLVENASPQIVTGTEEDLPALVNLDQFDVTTELEEHIAVLDAELSAAHVRAVPPDRVREMESTRAQLNQSLRRVSYAHSLLSL
jgi:hypothetical protein